MRRSFQLALRRFLRSGIAGLVVISACVRHSPSTNASREPRWLRWSVAGALSSTRLAVLTGAGLVRLRADGAPEPLLASGWEWITPTQLVFHLRADARWSDGTPITAGDFLSTWTARLQSNARAAELLARVRRAGDFAAGRVPAAVLGLHASNPRTLIVQVDEARALFVSAFADPSLWPARGKPLSPTGSGPFLAPRPWHAGTWRLPRNPLFPFPVAYEGIEISSEPSAENRLARFKEREVDLADDIDSALAARLNSGAAVYQSPQRARAGYRWLLAFNGARRPFSDRGLREIFAASIAREEPPSLLGWNDLVAAGFGWLEPGRSLRRGPAFNPAQAKSLFDGLPPETRAAHFTLVWDGRPDGRALAENLVAQWQKNLGISVEMAENETGAATLQLIAVDDDPLQPWNALTRLGGGRAPGGWRSARLDEAVLLATRAVDGATLERAIAQGEKLVGDEMVMAQPLLDKGRMVLRRARLHELTQDPFGNWDFARATLD